MNASSAADAAEVPVPPPAAAPPTNANETDDDNDNDNDNDDDNVSVASIDGAIRTVGGAQARVEALIERQLARARDERAEPNVRVRGDAQVRNAFLTLLPEAHQRLVFLRVAEAPAAWPRLRALFGAPPYDFLHPDDASTLRAAGFAHRRVHMAHGVTRVACSYSQFGLGQLEDELGRRYRVARRTPAADADPLPHTPDALLLGAPLPHGVHILHVRLPKVRMARRVTLLRSADARRQQLFPAAGERVVLRTTPEVNALCGQKRARGARAVELTVRRVVTRGPGARTAAVLAAL